MGEPRAIGLARISFGLLAIPVKVYSATESQKAISFSLLHRPPCSSRLKQQYVCAREEVVVPRDEMVKGYEFAKEQYVTFTPQELEALEERADQTIAIAEFVPLSQVDPIYFDKPYYLAPEKGAGRAYHLLASVMRMHGLSGLARYAARGKQYLVMLRPIGPRLVMQQLVYAHEVRSIEDVPMPDETVVVSRSELKLAYEVAAQICSETFDPSKYEDDVRKRIQADIDRKVAGQEIEAVPADGSVAQVVDLMEALKASLEAGSKSRRPKAPKNRPRSGGRKAAA